MYINAHWSHRLEINPAANTNSVAKLMLPHLSMLRVVDHEDWDENMILSDVKGIEDAKGKGNTDASSNFNTMAVCQVGACR